MVKKEGHEWVLNHLAYCSVFPPAIISLYYCHCLNNGLKATYIHSDNGETLNGKWTHFKKNRYLFSFFPPLDSFYLSVSLSLHLLKFRPLPITQSNPIESNFPTCIFVVRGHKLMDKTPSVGKYGLCSVSPQDKWAWWRPFLSYRNDFRPQRTELEELTWTWLGQY